jgi:hypothetical protein
MSAIVENNSADQHRKSRIFKSISGRIDQSRCARTSNRTTILTITLTLTRNRRQGRIIFRRCIVTICIKEKFGEIFTRKVSLSDCSNPVSGSHCFSTLETLSDHGNCPITSGCLQLTIHKCTSAVFFSHLIAASIEL